MRRHRAALEIHAVLGNLLAQPAQVRHRLAVTVVLALVHFAVGGSALHEHFFTRAADGFAALLKIAKEVVGRCASHDRTFGWAETGIEGPRCRSPRSVKWGYRWDARPMWRTLPTGARREFRVRSSTLCARYWPHVDGEHIVVHDDNRRCHPARTAREKSGPAVTDPRNPPGRRTNSGSGRARSAGATRVGRECHGSTRAPGVTAYRPRATRPGRRGRRHSPDGSRHR